MAFSSEMTWGAAAAAYQIEGAEKQDGCGLDVWDMLARTPGKIEDAHNGECLFNAPVT